MNRNRKKRRRIAAALARQKERYPKQCFCIEDGLSIVRDIEKDRVVRTFTAYSVYDFEKENPLQEPVYACANCGKEYTQVIWTA